MTDNLRGAALMTGSMLFFTINDTLVKLAAAVIPLWELLVLRGALASLMLAAICLWLGQFRRFAGRDLWLVALRSGSEIGAAYFFLTALINMPLANVTALLQLLPLTVTLAAALVFREPLGWRRLTAIAIGFCGMLLIVKPGTEGFNEWTIYALVAVLFVTVRDLSTRRMSREMPSMFVTFIGAITVTLFAAVMSLSEPWVMPPAREGAYLVGTALFVGAAYLCSVMVMRTGELGFVTPFRYTALVFALVLGFVVFGDWPGVWTLLGAAIIVGTGLFTLYRERRLSRMALPGRQRPV